MVVRDRMSEFRRGGGSAEHQHANGRTNGNHNQVGIGVTHFNPFEDVELGAPPQTNTAKGHLASASVHSTDQFLDEVNQMHLMMDKLEMQIQKLKIKQTAILGQVVVQPVQKDELEELITDIKKRTNELRPHLKKLESEISRDERGLPSEYMTGAEIRIRRDHCNHLKRKLRDLIDGFNDTQVEYKKRVSKRVKRQLDLAGERFTEKEVSQMLDSKSSEVFYRQVNPLSVAGRIALEDATARHQEILELERNIAQLNELFVDIYEMVHAQGTVVDNINTNVEAAVNYTGDAKVRIKQAVIHKQSARRKKIYCLIMVIVVLLILIAVAIVLGVTLSGGSRRE
ncbi:hypothetical protein L596_016875 [Steinernema carpocapsae]|uniref:t-SNARE coiled-coil homology domain-containing protein n=1 Tax=Steinernema carpocapsae TaxID=34508 RepID=A0A4U5NKU1_STECR|nr:hypothetical protein L596_016875 [Steinernema carpocapsae]